MSLALVPGVLLLQIANMAHSARFPELCRKTSTLWKSEPCKDIRAATYRDIFLQMIKVSAKLLAPYVYSQLTEARVQKLSRYLDPSIRSEIDLDIIRRTEQIKDWVGGYFLARLYPPTHNALWIRRTATNYYAVTSNLPFSTWIYLLQEPEFADHFIHIFQTEFPSFNLDRAGKIFCAANLLHYYRRAMTRVDSNPSTKLMYLKILTQLTTTADGRRAISQVGATTLLQGIAKLPHSGHAETDALRDQAIYALKNMGLETPLNEGPNPNSLAVWYRPVPERGRRSSSGPPPAPPESKLPPPSPPTRPVRSRLSLCQIQ